MKELDEYLASKNYQIVYDTGKYRISLIRNRSGNWDDLNRISGYPNSEFEIMVFPGDSFACCEEKYFSNKIQHTRRRFIQFVKKYGGKDPAEIRVNKNPPKRYLPYFY